MKKKIFKIFIILILCFICFTFGNLYNEKINNETTSENSTVNRAEIKVPDRIIFKYESKYYEILPEDDKFDEIVQVCINSIDDVKNESISEQDIDLLKASAKFVEFDYNTISKNNIFFLSTAEVGAVHMGDSDGTVISDKLNNANKIGDLCLDAIEGKTGYTMDTTSIKADNAYYMLPSTYDFEAIKSGKVYKKVYTSYDEFEEVAERYSLNFSNTDEIKTNFENKTGILFLTRYDITDFKVNIGNVKINFEGEDYTNESALGVVYQYQPILIFVSKIVNTNCIYYNYDNITKIDNVTGSIESISGVVKSKDENMITISYTVSDDFTLGRVTIPSDETSNIPINEIQVGDYITGSAKVTRIADIDGAKEYEAEWLYVQSKDEYNKLLEEYLMGKTQINTNIVDYYASESNYEGYVICEFYYGENSYQPDAYAKFYYDFYEGYTKSYLGWAENNVDDGDYGIQLHEIVDITFQEAVTDIDNIKVKTFEFIAD